MPINHEKLEGEPIFIITLSDPFDMQHELDHLTDLTLEYLDAANGPIFEIMDVRGLKLSFSDMVQGLVVATRDNKSKLIHEHPNMRKWIIVAASEILVFGANALNQVQYGEQGVIVFKTLEEALAFARQPTGTPLTSETH